MYFTAYACWRKTAGSSPRSRSNIDAIFLLVGRWENEECRGGLATQFQEAVRLGRHFSHSAGGGALPSLEAANGRWKTGKGTSAHVQRHVCRGALAFRGSHGRRQILLGHTSIRTTERSYSPWVKARQDRLEGHIRNAWDLETELRTQGRLMNTNLLNQNQLFVVEAAGVEPASEKARHAKTTCVSDSVNSTAT